MAVLQRFRPCLIHIKRNLMASCSRYSEPEDKELIKNSGFKSSLRDPDLINKQLFQDQKVKNKETFQGALDLFKNRNVRRTGAVEFIYAALKHMKAFGVEKDLEIYKSLIDVMPKEKYVAKAVYDAGFFYYPKENDCLEDVLQAMSENKVEHDQDVGALILAITGRDSKPYRLVIDHVSTYLQMVMLNM